MDSTFEGRTVLKWLVWTDLALVLAYLLTHQLFVFPSWTVMNWFDLDAEANLPTWFSSLQLAAIGILALLGAIRQRDRGISGGSFHTMLAVVFLFFSIDEVAGIHEGLNAILKSASFVSVFPDSQGLWILIYAGVLCALVLKFYRDAVWFVTSEPGRAMFLTGAGIFVLGGVGWEALGYYFNAEHHGVFYAVEVSFEEGLELLGQSLMICGLYRGLRPVEVVVRAVSRKSQEPKPEPKSEPEAETVSLSNG